MQSLVYLVKTQFFVMKVEKEQFILATDMVLEIMMNFGIKKILT